MSSSPLRLFLALASSSLFVACSGEGTAPVTETPAPTPVWTKVLAADVPTFADFLSREAALRCDQLGQLCETFGQARSRSCDDVLPNDVSSAPAVGTYSPEGAAACLNERAAAGLAGRLPPRVTNPAPVIGASACDEIFRTPAYRSVAVGGLCDLESDCVAPLGGWARCSVPSKGYDAVCKSGLFAKLGDACALKPEPSRPGLPTPDIVCDPGSLTYVPRPAVGEACIGGQCGVGALCLAAICRAPLGNGQTCANDYECAQGSCVGGLCGPLGKQGERCVSASDCASRICKSGSCERSYEYRDVCELRDQRAERAERAELDYATT